MNFPLVVFDTHWRKNNEKLFMKWEAVVIQFSLSVLVFSLESLMGCFDFDQYMKTHLCCLIFFFRTHVFESVHALSQINSHIQKENPF